MYSIDKINCLKSTIAIIGSGMGRDYNGIISERLNPSTAIVVVEDEHPLINIENIASCMRSSELIGVQPWSGSVNYKKKQIVLFDLKYYKAKTNNLDKSPSTNPNDWEEISIVSEQLERIVNSACNKLLNSVFEHKKLNNTVKTIVDDFYLFNGRADIQNMNPNLGRLVGFRIDLKDAKDLVAIINKIGVQFVGPAATIPIKLYHTSKQQPVATIEIEHTSTGNFIWKTIDVDNGLRLDYVSDLIDAQGTFYITYNEASVPGLQSLKKELNLTEMPACSGCDRNYYEAFMKRSRYLDIQPFYVDSDNFTDGQLWDESNEIYVNSNNFGLNLSFSIQCDLSDFICRNKRVFANALSMQITVDILKAFTTSTRTNQLSEKVSNDAYYALYGDKNTNNFGLIGELSKRIKAVSFDISELNVNCLPCESKSRIKHIAI